jgi:hypothetical protein
MYVDTAKTCADTAKIYVDTAKMYTDAAKYKESLLDMVESHDDDAMMTCINKNYISSHCLTQTLITPKTHSFEHPACI